jgi:hypothetical protein
MSDESERNDESPHGLEAISGVRFKGVGPMPSGWVLEKEAPWHLSAACMYAMGSGNGEIARAHGKSPQAVSNLFRQPWFQERVTQIMAENRRDVMDRFKAERFNSLETLVALRDNEKVPAAVRMACAKDILDRTLGKPTQRVEMAGEDLHFDNPCEEAERLEAEVRQLLKDLNFQP